MDEQQSWINVEQNQIKNLVNDLVIFLNEWKNDQKNRRLLISMVAILHWPVNNKYNPYTPHKCKYAR